MDFPEHSQKDIIKFFKIRNQRDLDSVMLILYQTLNELSEKFECATNEILTEEQHQDKKTLIEIAKLIVHMQEIEL